MKGRELGTTVIILFQCMLSFAKALSEGQLVWGPLLAWAKSQGDEFFDHKQAEIDEPFMLPRRPGCTVGQYPWSEHGAAFLSRGKEMLEKMGLWHQEQSVANIVPTFALNPRTSQPEQNKMVLDRALVRARPEVTPEGTVLTLLDEEFMSNVILTHVPHKEDLPLSDDQFFDFTADEHYSVWLHAQGSYWCPGHEHPFKVTPFKALGVGLMGASSA